MVDRVVSVLDREMYSEAGAARLLRVPQSTLHYWLEGGTRRGMTYRPIIRVEPREVRSVTWAEFIESGWLREYRHSQVHMVELRRFIDEMRERFGVPWPLADRRPLITGKKLVYEAQQAASLGPNATNLRVRQVASLPWLILLSGLPCGCRTGSGSGC